MLEHAGKQDMADTHQYISVLLINTHTYRVIYKGVSEAEELCHVYLFFFLKRVGVGRGNGEVSGFLVFLN